MVASTSHGLAVAVRMFGEVLNGGAFENPIVVVCIHDGHHVGRFEAFDIHDSDKAVARFEELCAAREAAGTA